MGSFKRGGREVVNGELPAVAIVWAVTRLGILGRVGSLGILVISEGEFGPTLRIWIEAFLRMMIKGASGGNSDILSVSRPATPRESKICEDVM